MRIKTGNTLTRLDVYQAAKAARDHGQDIYVYDVVQGTRGAITFHGYAYAGRYAANRSNGQRAATWDAWGYLIAELYNRDTSAVIGPYKDASHFIEVCASERDRITQYRPQDVPTHTAAFLDTLTF